MTTKMKWAIGVAGLAVIAVIAAINFSGGSDKSEKDAAAAEDAAPAEDDDAVVSAPAASGPVPAGEAVLSEGVPEETLAGPEGVSGGDDALTPGEGNAAQTDPVPQAEPEALSGEAGEPADEAAPEPSADDPTQ